LPLGVAGWHEESRALIFAARDKEGAVKACQRLFFNPDGTAALKEDGKKKRITNGVLAGSALSLPGEGDALICDGAEDGLSLWQATRRPVRVPFGAGNFCAVPLPTGAAVVLVHDNTAAEIESAQKAAAQFVSLGRRVSIARPPDGIKDSNDLLVAHGAEAVRDMVARASPFAAMPHDNEAENGLADDAKHEKEEDKHPAGFRMMPRGLIWSDPSGSEKREIVVVGPFEVLAESRDVAGFNWGILFRWKDPDGKARDWAMPRSLLAGDGAEVRRVLLDGGLYVAAGTKARGLLTTYLASIHVKERSRAVTSTGWFGSTFVLPDGAIGGTASEHIILQTPHFVDHAYNVRGTLDQWKTEIARIAQGNSRLVLAISAAFAAALVGPCGAESGGIHFRGRSSVGKTTALTVAGSVWGGGDRGFIRSWRPPPMASKPWPRRIATHCFVWMKSRN
jgi:putative DNA primase/helicase